MIVVVVMVQMVAARGGGDVYSGRMRLVVRGGECGV